MSWQKGKKEFTEESIGDGKHSRKKRERLFKKRFSGLSLFSGSPKNKLRPHIAPACRTSGRVHKSTLIASDDLIHLGNASVKLATLLSSDYSSPQGRNQIFEDKRRCLHRKGSKKLKPAREEICSLRQPHSGKMCPKCEILVCRKCETLHSESSFIAHSLLDHYDRGGRDSSNTLIAKGQQIHRGD